MREAEGVQTPPLTKGNAADREEREGGKKALVRRGRMGTWQKAYFQSPAASSTVLLNPQNRGLFKLNVK